MTCIQTLRNEARHLAEIVLTLEDVATLSPHATLRAKEAFALKDDPKRDKFRAHVSRFYTFNSRFNDEELGLIVTFAGPIVEDRKEVRRRAARALYMRKLRAVSVLDETGCFK